MDLTQLLLRLFVKDYRNTEDLAVRTRYGKLAGIVGIVCNVLLSAGKLLAGTLSGAVSITADGLNNLSDAASSLVTLLGFRLAGKKPDPHHPFGHGRLEYVSGLIVAGLILLMGVELAKSSVDKVLHPEEVTFSLLALGILAASVCVKLYMWLYNRRIGKKIKSAAMEATAMDSLSDTAATAAVLLAVMAADLLIFAYGMDGGQAALYVTLHLVLLGAAIWQVLALRQLQRGGEKLAEGDFSHPVTLSRGALPELKRHAENLNSVQAGIQRAVEEKMKSERLKTQLITNVSHDIKTPLTSIVNCVDLLKKEDIPSPAAQEYIAVLDRQSKRLKKLTEDLVEASKASSGALPVDVQPIDVSVLFSQIAGEYQDRLADCHLTLVTQSPEGQPVVAADSKLLSRVMDNLVSNICKYAMPGTRVYLSTEAGEDGVRMVVKNISRYPLNISADELTERFVRGDSSRSTEGSGLGLSIATSLTAIQGGDFRLTIDGDLFKVTLTLPRAEQKIPSGGVKTAGG